MKIKKSVEISDAKIQFMSLVDKASNKRQFLVTKASGGLAQFNTTGRILKCDDSTHYVTGIVYEPMVEDTQGNHMTESEIKKAAYWFAKNGDKVDIQHSYEESTGLSVVESYVAPCDMEIEGQKITKGTWLATVEVQNDEVWEAVQKGELTGFSMGGFGKFSDEDVELEKGGKAGGMNEKRDIVKKMAGLLGVPIIEKGDLAEKLAETTKSNNFWNVFYALEDSLYKYDYVGDCYVFLEDEEKIEELLLEFNTIITDILTKGEIKKSITGTSPIIKAGKKASSESIGNLEKAYETLTQIRVSLGGEESIKKGDIKLSKGEIKKMVDAAVKEATEAVKKADTTSEEDPVTEKDIKDLVIEAIKEVFADEEDPTEKDVKDMVAEAIKEAFSDDDDTVQKMVAKAVGEAMAPILKAKGLPSNLNGEQNPIDKSADAFSGFFI